MSQFLYHAVPQDFRGDTIYPLNQLKERYPDLYEARLKSYAWRPQVMQQFVHPLHCLWNDCIFMMATPPGEVKQALQQIRPGNRFPKRFWKIDPHLLNPENTTIYNFGTPRKPTPPEDFLPYDPDNLDSYSIIPQRTIEYWRECVVQNKERMLLYLYIPHILHKGVIRIEGLEVVEA